MDYKQIGLMVDKYELTMAQTYFKNNMLDHKTRFDYFFVNCLSKMVI